MIGDIIAQINKLDLYEMDAKELAVLIEMKQRYIEYLDELQDHTFNLSDKKELEVTVKVEGTTIKFKDAEAMSSWIITMFK